jgi:hypothetical protein
MDVSFTSPVNPVGCMTGPVSRLVDYDYQSNSSNLKGYLQEDGMKGTQGLSPTHILNWLIPFLVSSLLDIHLHILSFRHTEPL